MTLMQMLMVTIALAVILVFTGCASAPKYNAYKSAKCFCSDSGGIRFFKDEVGVICTSGANANSAALENIDLCGEK